MQKKSEERIKAQKNNLFKENARNFKYFSAD